MRCKNFITTWSIYYFNSWKYSLLFHQLISFSWFHEIKGKVTLWSILLHGSKAKAFNWSNRNPSTSVKGINSQSISTNIITLLGKLLNLNYWWMPSHPHCVLRDTFTSVMQKEFFLRIGNTMKGPFEFKSWHQIIVEYRVKSFKENSHPIIAVVHYIFIISRKLCLVRFQN